MGLLEEGIGSFPDNPDYTYLAALVGPMVGHPIDLDHAVSNLTLIGEGTRYDDWIADPAALLGARMSAQPSAA
jgi:hypothetical protein